MPTGGIKIVCEANLSSLSGCEPTTSEEASKGLILTTQTTNTFTPSQLRNIEQMFMDAESSNPPEVYKNAAGFAPPVVTSTTGAGGRTYVNLDSRNWQGGTTTVVTPSSAAPFNIADLQSSSGMEERRVNRGGGRRSVNVKDEELSAEEEERRRVRRERNKLAAARCRKRRVDQTESLQQEVNSWEEKKRQLQEEIHNLTAQKEELQFILDAHKSVCKQQQRQQPLSQKQIRVAVTSVSGEPMNMAAVPRVVVKAEPTSEVDTVRHLTHAEAMDEVQVHSTTSAPPAAATTSIYGKPQRPASLSLTSLKSNSMRCLEGIPIDTPTNAISSLNFDALMDGRTGLTPTNILTPINLNVSSSVSALNTPSTSTPSCGSQQRNSGSMYVIAELGSPTTGAPNLVSL